MARTGWAYVDFSYLSSVTGPTGSVQFLVDESTLSGSHLFVYDTGSNRVGIGLTTFDGEGAGLPTHQLHVVGDVSVTGSIYADNHIIKNVSHFYSDGSSNFGDSTDDLHEFTGSVSITNDLTVGTTALYVDSTNNRVGIGTASPEGVLHTVDNSGVTIFQRSNNSAAYGTNLYIRKSRGSTGSESNVNSGDMIGQMSFSPYYGDFDNQAASISSKVEGTLATDTTPGNLIFSTTAAGANSVTERMRIDSAGMIGIGVTDPDAQLEVLRAGTQLKLSYDSNSYATLSVGSDSALTIASAETGDITLDPGGSDVVADGNFLPNADSTRNLGSPALRWANVYTNDLHLKNERGDWTVVEESEYLTLRNNTTGKRYKIMMEEIED